MTSALDVFGGGRAPFNIFLMSKFFLRPTNHKIGLKNAKIPQAWDLIDTFWFGYGCHRILIKNKTDNLKHLWRHRRGQNDTLKRLVKTVYLLGSYKFVVNSLKISKNEF